MDMSLFRLSNHIFELELTSPSMGIALKLCKASG